MRVSIRLNAALVLAAFALTASGQGERPADLPEGALAWQGGAVVTLQDVDARVARIPNHSRAAVMDDPQRIQDLVGTLLVNRQLGKRAEDMDLHEDPGFAAEMALIREEVLARRYLEHMAENAPPADIEALAREEYLTNRSRFALPGGPRVSHILIATAGRDPQEARQSADEVLAKLKAGELDFAAAVQAYSDDPGKRGNQGAIGLVDDRLDPSFRAAAETLAEPGQLSDVVKTEYGYHVIRLDGLDEPRQLSFDEVRTGLMARVELDRQARTRAEAVEAVRALPLDADPDAVFSLRTRYRADGSEDAGS